MIDFLAHFNLIGCQIDMAYEMARFSVPITWQHGHYNMLFGYIKSGINFIAMRIDGKLRINQLVLFTRFLVCYLSDKQI